MSLGRKETQVINMTIERASIFYFRTGAKQVCLPYLE